MTGVKIKTGTSIILALFLVASITGVVMADWPTDPSTNAPVVTADHDQGSHRVIADGSGGFFAVWQDYRGNSSYDIYAQMFDADGNPLWTVNGVSVCTDLEDQNAPKICLDGNDGCIIAWQDDRGSNVYIYAQRLNGDGTAQWADDGVMVSQSPPPVAQRCPWSVTDDQGGAIISWVAETEGIYLQRMNSSGNRLWGNYVRITDSGAASMQKLISDGQGGAIITWVEDEDIYIQRVDSSGNELWSSSDVCVCNADNQQICPRIISSGTGAIVIWQDYRDTSNRQIFAQKVNSSGDPQWSDNGVCVFSGSSDGDSHGLASDEAGGAIITWAQDDGDEEHNVYARRIDSNGNLMWGSPTQITDTGDYLDISDSPRKTVEDGAGGAITTWIIEDYEIYAQRVDGTGNTLWAENGILLCDAAMEAGKRSCPRLAACDTSCGATGVLAYWAEARYEETGQDIYMQGIGPDGILGKPCTPCSDVPVGSEAYPINKLNLVMPLIVMGIATFTGAYIIRRQHSSVF